MSITANGRFAVYAISTQDGAWRSVTEAETVSDPAWSADGSTISFLSAVPRRGENTYEVFTVAAAGGEARRIAIRADTLNTATTDGSGWLVQRSQEQDQWTHQLVLVDDAGEMDRLVLPPLEIEHIGAAALAPCALRPAVAQRFQAPRGDEVFQRGSTPLSGHDQVLIAVSRSSVTPAVAPRVVGPGRRA